MLSYEIKENHWVRYHERGSESYTGGQTLNGKTDVVTSNQLLSYLFTFPPQSSPSVSLSYSVNIYVHLIN